MGKLRESMKNVLCVLPAHDPDYLSRPKAAEAALDARSKGFSAFDITIDPRRNVALNEHLLRAPLPQFTRIAKDVAENVIAPVVGRSAVRDFSGMTARVMIEPNLSTLSTVGTLFAKAVGHTGGTIDGASLGLLFYLTLHARTEDRKDYSHIIFPAITPAAENAIILALGCDPVQETIAQYGPAINLRSTRERLNALRQHHAQPQSNPQYPYLN